MQRPSVDLPQPDSPMMLSVSPRYTFRLTLLSACRYCDLPPILPERISNSFERSLISRSTSFSSAPLIGAHLLYHARACSPWFDDGTPRNARFDLDEPGTSLMQISVAYGQRL